MQPREVLDEQQSYCFITKPLANNNNNHLRAAQLKRFTCLALISNNLKLAGPDWSRLDGGGGGGGSREEILVTKRICYRKC